MLRSEAVFSLEAIFAADAPLARSVWSECRSILQAASPPGARFRIVPHDRRVALETVDKAIAQETADAFEVESETALVKYQWCPLDVMSLELSFAAPPAHETLDAWVVAFASAGPLIFARGFDPEYDRWQNETQLEAFRLLGKSTEALKLGWDSTFNEPNVDISANPGRCVHRHGYREALGHLMWLAPRFWKATGARREKIHKTFKCKQVDGLLRVELSAVPFSDANPPSEAQRNLLFPLR